MHRRKPPERRGKAGVKAATGPLNRPDQDKRRVKDRRLCVFAVQPRSLDDRLGDALGLNGP